jgi:hypothetical protein
VFRITSLNVTVTGSEHLARTGPFTCTGGAGGSSVSIGPIKSAYKATIVTPTRTYHEHGTSWVTTYQDFGLGLYWDGSLSDKFTSARRR